MMGLVEKPLPRLDQEIRDRIKETDADSYVKDLLFNGLPKETINPDDFRVSYDRRTQRIVLRTEACRVVFLGIENRNPVYLERVLDILDRERPS